MAKISGDVVLTEVGKWNMGMVVDETAMLERHEFLIEDYLQLCGVDVYVVWMDQRRLWLDDTLKQYEALGGEFGGRLE